ncbi:hypothetical protein LA080_009720 [Diaporthe eres]|nr:hypothetical protein LA080_009720 [Diaporthe eres]
MEHIHVGDPAAQDFGRSSADGPLIFCICNLEIGLNLLGGTARKRQDRYLANPALPPTCLLKYRAPYPRTTTISPASENTSHLLDRDIRNMYDALGGSELSPVIHTSSVEPERSCQPSVSHDYVLRNWHGWRYAYSICRATLPYHRKRSILALSLSRHLRPRLSVQEGIRAVACQHKACKNRH